MVDQGGFCTECGAAVSSTDKFCAGCGHNLGVTPPPPARPLPKRGIPKWGWLVLAALVVLVVVAIGAAANDSPFGSSERAVEMNVEKRLTLSEAWCSDIRKGTAPFQLWRSVKDTNPDVAQFAGRALTWMERDCPEQISKNEAVREWLLTWGLLAEAEVEAEEELWLGKYSMKVKNRIDQFAANGDCDGLQDEFDQAWKNDPLTQARYGTGSEDLLTYIDDEMAVLKGHRRGCTGDGQFGASGWCNQLRLGVDPAELWPVIGHMHGDVESFVIRAGSWAKRHCPEQAGNDTLLRWINECGPPLKTDRCKDWRD